MLTAERKEEFLKAFIDVYDKLEWYHEKQLGSIIIRMTSNVEFVYKSNEISNDTDLEKTKILKNVRYVEITHGPNCTDVHISNNHNYSEIIGSTSGNVEETVLKDLVISLHSKVYQLVTQF